MTITLGTADGVHLLCVEENGLLVANRTVHGPWEEFTIVPIEPGVVAIECRFGYLSALSDEECRARNLPLHTVMGTARYIDIWERWRVVRHGAGIALCSYWNLWLSPQHHGGADVLANGPEPAAWELLLPSSLAAFGLSGRPSAGGNTRGHVDPWVGQMRIKDGAFVGDTGPKLPCGLHAMDLLGHGMLHGVDKILPTLDFAASCGYHYLRSGFQLNITTGKWLRGPTEDGWDPRDHRERFRDGVAAGAERGLKWHLAGLGLKGLSDRDENEIFDLVGDVIGEVGPEHFALIEGCNEVRDTGDRDDRTPAELERLINRIRSRFPQILYALTAYTGHENRDGGADDPMASLRLWTPAWMQFYLVHGSRDGRVHDKIRHAFSLGYPGEAPVVRYNGWQGEWVGPGRLLSATSNGHELDAHTMKLLAAMAAMARQNYCYMSGPGVVMGDEPWEEMPGIREVPALLREMPQDLMRYRTIGHSGQNRSERIHAVRGDARDVREDYVIHDDGRYLAVRYGPPDQPHDLPRKRGTSEGLLEEGPWGHVEVGRV